MNTNIESLYDYVLRQMAAESYFEGIELASASDANLKQALRIGANRIGYPQGAGAGNSSLNARVRHQRV